jgi:Mce-associated membrane protein
MNAVGLLPEQANEGQVAVTTETGRLGRRARWTMAVVLVLLIVVAGVVLAVSYPRERAYQTDVANRADVVRVAERFTTLANNYDVASIGGYQKSIAPLLTTKFRSDFRQAMRDIVASVKKSKMTSHGQVLASAVSGIDQDSATALVVADAKVTSIYDTRARHFRWKVSLVKVNGHWLVDDFQPVG